MNSNTISAECAHGFHGHCEFENCACACHFTEDPEMNDPPEDETP